MISYGEFLLGNLKGMSYFLNVFNELSLAWLGWAVLAGPGRAVLGRPVLVWAGLGWPGLAWDVMGFQSTVENPHKISS